MGSILSIDQDDVETLVELGLNGSQAKIYLTLISLGAANAKKIAQTANMDNGEVYRQLEILERRGLVEKVLKFPTEYTPTPLNETLKLLIKQKDKESLELGEKVKKLLQKNDKIIMPEQGQFHFSLIPLSRFTFDYMTKKHREVQRESLWYTQIQNLPPGIEESHEFWDKNTNKNARLRTIAELRKCPDSTFEYIKKFKANYPYFDFRLSESNLDITFWINDDRELYVYTETRDKARDVLWTNNPIIVKSFRELFELKWNVGVTEPQKRKIANVASD